MAEAQRQAIPHVIWLTLRTADVSYQDPQERASSDGYREDNRTLYEKAEQLGGYLQIADWATYSEDRSDWFFGDGVHLTDDGVSALDTFIADSVDAVLAGASLNPDVVPWATLESGDSGDSVADVQRALVAAGLTTVGVADGEYGELTAQAVAEFQRTRGLTVTGIVNESTAIALGVHGEPAAEPATVPAPPTPIPVPTPTMLSISVPVPGRATDEHRRRDRADARRRRGRRPRAARIAAASPAVGRVRHRVGSRDVIATRPYDHEREDLLVH